MHTDRAFPPPASIDPTWKIGIVYSAHYEEETLGLVEGAKKYLLEAGLLKKNVTLHPVSGAFEIPLIGAQLAARKKVDALIALGIIVEGETHHADLVAAECARGVMDVQITHHIPFAFEVLYVDKLSQAKTRSSGEANKGAEAAFVTLHSLAELRRIGC